MSELCFKRALNALFESFSFSFTAIAFRTRGSSHGLCFVIWPIFISFSKTLHGSRRFAKEVRFCHLSSSKLIRAIKTQAGKL